MIKMDSICFIFVCFICLCIFYRENIIISIGFILSIIIMLVIIKLFNNQLKSEKEIYNDKRALILFILVYIIILFLIISINNIFNLNNITANQINFIYVFLIHIGIISMVFLLAHIFGIDIRNFNFNISTKWILIILLIYLSYRISTNIFFFKILIHVQFLNVSFIPKFLLNTIYDSFYPGIYEELVYRGFLISGLKGMELDDSKCNIIQSMLFGTMHVLMNGNPSLMFNLSTARQALIGFVLGKIYLKTKSLTPCILLHGLIDAI